MTSLSVYCLGTATTATCSAGILGTLRIASSSQHQPQGGNIAPPSPANPNGSRWWGQQHAQQQGQQPHARQQQANPRCSICKAAHREDCCWYNNPRTAPDNCAPSLEAPFKAISTYQQRCAELGIAAKQPGSSSSSRAVCSRLLQPCQMLMSILPCMQQQR